MEMQISYNLQNKCRVHHYSRYLLKTKIHHGEKTMSQWCNMEGIRKHSKTRLSCMIIYEWSILCSIVGHILHDYALSKGDGTCYVISSCTQHMTLCIFHTILCSQIIDIQATEWNQFEGESAMVYIIISMAMRARSAWQNI